MGFHLSILSTLKSLSEEGEPGATASILQLLYSHPAEIDLESNMALKLRCVEFIFRRIIGYQKAYANTRAST